MSRIHQILWGNNGIYQTSSLIHKPQRIQQPSRSLFTPYLCIPSNIPLIDELIGGYKANIMTYLYGAGSYLNHIPYDLCLHTYTMFQGVSVFIDGATSMNPYLLSRYAKIYELPTGEVLDYVRVSRAFTLHQFHHIVDTALEPLLCEQRPQTLIVHAFPLLYHDQDVPFHEAKTLFTSTLETLQRLTKTYQLITVITNPHCRHQQGMDPLHHFLFDTCDEQICIQQMKQCPRIFLPRYQQATTLTWGVTGQLCLKDFGMVV